MRKKPLHPGEIVRDALCNEVTGLTVGEAAVKLAVQRTTTKVGGLDFGLAFRT